MSISVTCSGCSTKYVIDDVLAGKKLRCKKCSEVIAIPVPQKAIKKKSSNDFFDEDDLKDQTLIDDVDDDDEDQKPARRSPKKPALQATIKKTKGSKKSRKSSSGNILGLTIGGPIVAGILFAVVKAVVKLSLLSGHWAPYDIPAVPGFTIEMPHQPKQFAGPTGNPGISCETSGFLCAASSEPLQPALSMMFSNLAAHQGTLKEAAMTIYPGAVIEGSRILSTNGAPTFELTIKIKATTTVKRAFIAGNRCVSLDFAFSTARPSVMERFFNSFKAGGGKPAPGIPNIPFPEPQFDGQYERMMNDPNRIPPQGLIVAPNSVAPQELSAAPNSVPQQGMTVAPNSIPPQGMTAPATTAPRPTTSVPPSAPGKSTAKF